MLYLFRIFREAPPLKRLKSESQEHVCKLSVCVSVCVCLSVLIKLIWNDSQISGRVCGFFPQFDFIGLEKRICEAWRPFQSSSYHMHVYTAFFIVFGHGRVIFIFILTLPTFSDTTCWPTFWKFWLSWGGHLVGLVEFLLFKAQLVW